MNLSNFASGIISSAAHSRLRDVSAADTENVEHDDEGALRTRAGIGKIPTRSRISTLFAHWGFVLAVTGTGELKWETENNLLRNINTDADRFQSFDPVRTGFSIVGRNTFFAQGNTVFVSSPNSQLKITLETGETPVAVPFYIPALMGTYSYPEGNTTGVFVRLQPVKVDEVGENHLYYPIEAVGESFLFEGRSGSAGNIAFELTDAVLPDDTDANYIDIFHTRSDVIDENAVYYFRSRVVYAPQTYSIGILPDTHLETQRTLIEPLETPVWEIVESSDERLYLNSGSDNRLWMTYHDTGESYFRTVTDYVDLSTGGRAITGLKLMSETALVAYTANRIFLIDIDPIAEQHRVSQIISTRDDRDAPIGCIAPESLVSIDDYHYFLGGDRQVYRFGGMRPTWVSEPINPHLAQVPRIRADRSVAFAREKTYCLSYPSEPTSRENDAMLLYDTQRRVWWKDAVGLLSVSKGLTQYAYAVRNDNVAVLLNYGTVDPDDTPIEWTWKGNKILLPLNTLIHSLFIGLLPGDIDAEALTVTVTAKTEEGEQTHALTVESALNYWQQYVGFNLRGRSVQVTLSGAGAMKLDRLIFNPEP